MADEARQAASRLAFGKSRLPPGRHGLPREFVAENQRERLLNGVVDAVAEHGYNQTTIGAIAEAAKISRRTFYEYFEDKEACFLAAYGMIDEHVRGAMLAAGDPAAPWPERVRDRLAALLGTLTRDRAVARFYLIEPLAAGGEVAARYREAMRMLAETIRPQSAPPELNVEVRDQALMGGIATLIARRLKAGGTAGLHELLPDLTELALTPYLGREEARRLALEAAA
ncbi:MAG TPA: TetR/AcrR family transcriptional regulator [Solirubrobacterales bacterium]|nr:TetR/AcrR family transcriptional regulator [Solirubrobacterales bacterium]